MPADPGLIGVWTRAWAISRGVSPPIASHGGFYIDVGLPDQRSRYVFPRVERPVLRELARAIDEPRVFLKVCEAGPVVLPLLPPKWVLQPPRFMMTGDLARENPALEVPGGYTVQIGDADEILTASIFDGTGAAVARGRTIVLGSRAILDGISTDESHRRRGLGRALVGALVSGARRRGATEGILCATAQGRELYATLGWKDHSPYSSFVIPGDA